MLKGKLKLGKTVQPNELMRVTVKKMHDRKEKDDVFGTQKKLALGPGDYNVSVDLIKKSKSPTLDFIPKSTDKALDEEQTFNQQFKQIRQFDGSAASIKKIVKPIKHAPLEERQVVADFASATQSGSKAT